MGFVVALSLLIPGLVLVLRQKEFPNPSSLGFVAGAAPLIASAAWSIYFIARYHAGYSFDEMQRMEMYKMEHYVLVPIAMPLYANLIWRRSVKPSLVRERLMLIGAFIGVCILAENTPETWSFTFVLFPASMLILLIGFLFLKRRPASSPDGQ